MKINDDHMYHGAALTQIAEHPQFTAINAFKKAGAVSRSAFRVNDDTGVYLKYASRPKGSYDEYVFTFGQDHLAELDALKKGCTRVFLALVCVHERHICCLPYSEFLKLLAARKNAKGSPEAQYTVLVTAPAGKSFRVYMNAPGKRKTMLGDALIISRNNFPGVIF
ncbi:MAG: hypothetical protein RL885_05050 [Planctomycetota bacterium]